MQNVFSTSEAAALLNVHEKTVLNWCVNGKIPAHRTSPTGHWRITREDLEEYATENGIPLTLDE